MKRFFFFIILFFLLFQSYSQEDIEKVIFPDIDNERFVGEDFPVVFDLRNTERISPVKTQPNGGCWASAATGSVESIWRTYGFGYFELSDINLKLYHGFVPERSTNGNHYMATAYFSRRSGPLLKNPETDSLYHKEPATAAYITDARYLPNDPQLIKQSIMDYGAVYSMMYYKKEILDTINNTYYTDVEKINHAVNLVGWNDTLITQGRRGAWIAQNSLGEKFGEKGFFYISYEDENILNYNAIWNKWIPYEPNSKIYYYDTLGSFYSYGFRDTICYGLVKYTAESDLEITKTGTFVNFPNTKIYAEIYKEFNDSSKALSGKLSEINEYHCKYAGYYTLDLDVPVQVAKGKDFFIMMRYITPNDTLPLPIETFIDGYSEPHVTSGKCWVNPNYEKWQNTWYECGPASEWKTLNFDLCIKVYCIKIRKN